MTYLLGVLCFLFLFTVHHINGVLSIKTNSTDEWVTEISTTSEGTTPISTTPKVQNRNLCQVSFTKVNGKNMCKGKLIFQELFNSLSDKWKPENRFAGDPDYEFAIYSNNKTNAFVKQNFLYIKPTLTEERYGVGYVTNRKGIDFGTECTGYPESLECVQQPRAWQILPPVISAQISTKNSFSFLYGNIEIKAKFPKGDWLYPEISLVSKLNSYGPGLESGRIRIAYSPGNNNLSSYLWSGCTLGYSNTDRKFAMRYVNLDRPWYEDFHVYKLQWKVDGIVLYVDNEVYGTIYPPYDGFASEPSLEVDEFTRSRWLDGTLLAPFDQEMYIVIGVGVGGQMFHQEAEIEKPWINDDPKAQLHFYKKYNEWSKTWNSDSQLIVDYVKVWAV